MKSGNHPGSGCIPQQELLADDGIGHASGVRDTAAFPARTRQQPKWISAQLKHCKQSQCEEVAGMKAAVLNSSQQLCNWQRAKEDLFTLLGILASLKRYVQILSAMEQDHPHRSLGNKALVAGIVPCACTWRARRTPWPAGDAAFGWAKEKEAAVKYRAIGRVTSQERW